VHRDLKPENILINTSDENQPPVKLIDFGTSYDTSNDKCGAGNGSTGRKVFLHFVGTPQYMPPEFVRNKGSFLKSDIYSFGIMLFQMVTGFSMYRGGSEWLIFQ
jgi:serine/threonine protein kinase